MGKLLRGVGAFGIGFGSGTINEYDRYRGNIEFDNRIGKYRDPKFVAKEPSMDEFYGKSKLKELLNPKSNVTKVDMPEANFSGTSATPSPPRSNPESDIGNINGQDAVNGRLDAMAPSDDPNDAPEKLPDAMKYDENMWDSA